MAIRFDRGELAKPVKQRNGWLRLDGYLTRTGVFEYLQPDGTKRRELRPADEVFKADSLTTFSMVPVTDEHPPVMLDASNTTQYSRGAVSESVRADGDKVRASLLVTDAGLIEKIERKDAQQVSCGYTCDLEEVAGEHQGHRYDAIQRNIRGNHVAIVARGRAGEEVRVRMDGAATAVDRPCQAENPGANDPDTTTVAPGARGTTTMKTIRIDGVDYDPSTEAFAQALAKYEAKLAQSAAAAQEKLDAAEKRADATQAKMDGLADELKKAQEAAKELPAKVRADMAARAELDAKARKVLGAEAKLDALDAKGVRLAVLAKLLPEVKFDGKSEAYLEARFDAALESAEGEDESAWAKDASKLDAEDKQVEHLDSDAAREKFLEASRNAWKKPLSTTKA
jgi:hypothetical protein